MMKYKLLQQTVVENIIAFLDECQNDASLSPNHKESMDIINFCNWAIKELLNAKDGVVSELPKDGDSKKVEKRWDKIDEKFFDWKLPPDMPEQEFDKMLNQFDAFLRGWEKEYNKNNPEAQIPDRNNFNPPPLNDVAQFMSLEEIKEFLLDDPELTEQERFELYYDERERRKPKEKGLTYNQLLKQAGIKNTRKN